MSIKKILTRRDFLGSGIVHSFGSVFLPSLATLLRNERAIAAGEACSINGQQMPAFIAIDLQGGGNIAGTNVIVRDKGGALLTDYTGLGLVNPPDENDDIDSTFGMQMHKSSPMLRGMKATTTAEVQANVNGFVICSQSADDTRNNKMATAPGIFKAGCNGSIVPLVGMMSASAGGSGGNSMTPFGTDVAPTLIENLASAQQLISAGELWTGQRAARLEKVLKAVENLSSTRLEALGKLSLPEQTAAMVECSYAKGNKMMSGGDKPNLDPNADPDLRKAPPAPKACWWGHGHGGKANAEAIKQVGYMVLKGYAGSGTITLPGFDYHDGSVDSGFGSDIQAGRVIGEMLSMAAALKRKLMIHVYTDGGVDSASGKEDGGKTDEQTNCKNPHTTPADGEPTDQDGKTPKTTYRKAWTGDSESRAAAFVLVYDPAGRPNLTTTKPQEQHMGAYQDSDNGTVDLQPGKHNAISNNSEAHAAAVVANYLAWQGREADLFTKVMSNSPIRETELSNYLFLQKP